MKKITQINQYELPLSITRDGDGYFAKSTTWSDCYAQGDTIEETISEITSVAASLIELYEEEGIKIPLEIKRKSNLKDGIKFEVPVVVAS